MTNLQHLISRTNLKVLAVSSVWAFHNIDSLDNVAMRKGSNLNSKLVSLKKGGLDGMVTLYADSIGRSGHSETSVTVLQGVTNRDACCEYYSKRMGEINLDINIHV